MNIGGQVVSTFGLLGLAICAVWLPPFRPGKNLAVPPWIIFFLGAIVCGWSAGMLSGTAIAALGVFAVVAYLGRTESSGIQRIVFGTFSALLALALAMHLLRGFKNSVLVANIQFSDDGAPFTQIANFDKASVGLLLLVFFCRRCHHASQWHDTLRRALPVMGGTAAVVIMASLAIGYVKPDVKLSGYTPVFLATNLLFTCVAEEAFFRGFLQERLAASLVKVRFGPLIAVVASGILFGAAHFAAGLPFMLLATVAGLGYAYAYALTRRIEAPILTHFVLNAVHFIGFTYPHLR